MAKSRTVRRIALWTIAVAVVAGLLLWRATTRLTESKVEAMLQSGELVGLSLEDAGRRLGHSVPATDEGIVRFEQFEGSDGWSRRAVEVEVTDGRITAAGWAVDEQR